MDPPWQIASSVAAGYKTRGLLKEGISPPFWNEIIELYPPPMPVGYPLLQGECMGGGVGGWAPTKLAHRQARRECITKLPPRQRGHTWLSLWESWHDAVVTERAALKRGPRGSWCPLATSARRGSGDQGVGWLPPRGNKIPPQRSFRDFRMHGPMR